jgi:diacylglycerol kinase (ATP)
MNNVSEMKKAPGLRCLIIANPEAGQLDARLVDDLGAACARQGADVRIRWTRRRGHAVQLAREAVGWPPAGQLANGEFTVVVAAGGDGTAREVACGMVLGGARPLSHALLVIPAGTGNSTYRALWDELPWQEAVAAGLGDPLRRVRSLDLAAVAESGHLVLLGAGAGLTAQVLDGARGVALTGASRLQAGLERAMSGYVPYPGRVTVDGKVLHEGPTLFANVGGGRYRAWQYLVLPCSVMDDGLLDVCVVGTGIGVSLEEFQALLALGQHLGRPGVLYGRGRSVVLERTDGSPLCFEHDGELVAGAGQRVTIEVRPRLLPVLCASAGNRP